MTRTPSFVMVSGLGASSHLTSWKKEEEEGEGRGGEGEVYRGLVVPARSDHTALSQMCCLVKDKLEHKM